MSKPKINFVPKDVFIMNGSNKTSVGRFAFSSDIIRIMNGETVSDCIDIKINADNVELHHLWFPRVLCEKLKHLVDIPLLFTFLNILAQSLHKPRIILTNSATIDLPQCDFKLDRFMQFIGKRPYYEKFGFHYVDNGVLDGDAIVDFARSDDEEVIEWAKNHKLDQAPLKDVLKRVYTTCNGEEEFPYSSVHSFLQEEFVVGKNVMEKLVKPLNVQVIDTPSEMHYIIQSGGKKSRRKRPRRRKTSRHTSRPI